ncbi:MAG TPA: hypothetical protein PK987_03145 [Ferruginibacter sp.]|nr:hypothetical protein [Ferruginibacter sp.]
MKHHFNILLVSIILLNACSKGTSDKVATVDSTYYQGKHVIDENSDVKIVDPKTGAFNDFNNKNTNPEKTNQRSAYDEMKKKYKNLLIFHAADTMRIKKSYIATLVLGKDQLLGDLKNEVMENDYKPTDSLYTDTALDLGSKMKARLIDMSGVEHKGFIIELLGGEEAATQSITERRKKVIWQWKLTPQSPGLQELRLSINVVERNGEMVNLPAKNISVLIYAEKETTFAKIKSFFDEYGKWILASILIPIFVAWFTTRMRYKSLDKPFQEKDNEQPTTANTNNIEKPAKPTTTASPNTIAPTPESEL